MNDISTSDQAPVLTDTDLKIEHLMVIVSELGRGVDVIEEPSANGGLLLNHDEDDVIEMAVLIEAEIVPLYYQGDWLTFIIHLLCVVKNAQDEKSEDIMDDFLYFLNTLRAEGKVQVAST